MDSTKVIEALYRPAFREQFLNSQVVADTLKDYEKTQGRNMNHENNIDFLKKVFTYGNATGTHIDILNYLNSIGISVDEYSKWG